MPPTRGRRSALSERACLECQKRKTRCVAQNSGRACEYCAKSKRTCIVPAPPSRIPLTRNNLDNALSRCQVLEALLESSKAPGKEPGSATPGIQEDGGMRVESEAPAEGPRHGNRRERSYEWDESIVARGPAIDLEHGHDGMVSLGASGARSGYLGTTSGQAMLESIASNLPPSTSSPLHKSHQAGSNSLPHDLTAPLPNLRLSTSSLHHQLISAYFEYYNTSYPVLHEATFRAQCDKRFKLTGDDGWQMLYFMVLALGEWVGGFSSDEESIYFDAAKSRFQLALLERGNLCNVQGLLLMCNYLQKRDRPNTGFNVLGIAHRMAIGLGLHREPSLHSNCSKTTLSGLRRRIVFWILYCFDSGFSITTGRPTTIDDSFIDILIPPNTDDASCRSPEDQPTEVCYPTQNSCIIAQARLAKIANKIYTQFSSISPTKDANRETFIMERMLEIWRASLPPFFFSRDVPVWFSRSRKVVLWKEANIRILLLLAGQRQTVDVHEKIAIGQRYQLVAADTLKDIYKFYQDSEADSGPNLAWYAVYFVLQAVLALSVHEMAKNNVASLPVHEGSNKTYDDLIDTARQTLGELLRHSEKSEKALHHLARLRKGVSESRASARLTLVPNVANQSDLADATIQNMHSSLHSESNHVRQALDHSGMLTECEPFSGFENFSAPGFSDFMDQAFENGDLLSELFQNCYGPSQF